MNRCHGNQSCHIIFIKTSYSLSIHCLQLSYEKVAQKVRVFQILHNFSHIYPTHSRSVYNLTGMILDVLFKKVPHMLPAKY